MMLFSVFLAVVAVVLGRLIFQWGIDDGLLINQIGLNETWTWLIGAHKRRKKVEKILAKQRLKYKKLEAEHLALTQAHRVLAGDVLDLILGIEDQKVVTKSLTRKVPRKKKTP